LANCPDPWFSVSFPGHAFTYNSAFPGVPQVALAPGEETVLEITPEECTANQVIRVRLVSWSPAIKRSTLGEPKTEWQYLAVCGTPGDSVIQMPRDLATGFFHLSIAVEPPDSCRSPRGRDFIFITKEREQ
jgi:hypothetical protein